ncbi:hypothetical protein AGMMS49992_27880 [Clostridia bacterium]|nr:hypothetical protein AGMMS49992_27880 [Clostridia bacterium]
MRLHKGLSNGRLYLSIVEGYRDPITKNVNTRTLRSLACVCVPLIWYHYIAQ